MEARIHPIGIHGRKILDLKLNQGPGKLLRVTLFDCERIWFVLSATCIRYDQE